MDKLCRIRNATHINMLLYRRQSNGITERLNSSLVALMTSLVDKTSDTWDESPLTVQSCINGIFHISMVNPLILSYMAQIRD